MWNMTSFGILMPAIRPRKSVPAGDSRTLQVRTRRAKDLDILRAVYMQGSLGPTLHTPDFDYEYRAYCEPAAYGMALARMAMEIDYAKFKPTTEDKFSDRDLHNCYTHIWSVVMAQLSTKDHRESYWLKHPSSLDFAPVVAGGASRFWDGQWDDELDRAEDVEYLAELAKFEAELDRLKADEPAELDHQSCDHAETDQAAARCRREQLEDHEARISEIEMLMTQSVEEDRARISSSSLE